VWQDYNGDTADYPLFERPAGCLMKLIRSFVLFFFAAFLCITAEGITIDTVPIGDPGNPNHSAACLCGGVGYLYDFGKYEVTVGQYTAFLNAVAATDTYSLYSTNMASDLAIAGISRTGSPGSYLYSVIGSANHPVTYVSWGDAARFANWMHNGQPPGPEGPATTETGAYTLNGAVTDSALTAVVRNPGATWVLPTIHEWHKAAYYQPTAKGGDSDGYWKWPMKTNNQPYSDQPPGATPNNTRVANVYQNDGLSNGYDDGYAVTGATTFNSNQNYLTDVGAYASSPSYYGTFDQRGNVSEWSERKESNNTRFLLGGSWQIDFELVGWSSEDDGYLMFPSNEFNEWGFRLANVTASIPEPSSAMLAASIFVLLGSRRRRRESFRA
jgi:MYXO-CTERM domain-containing protein